MTRQIYAGIFLFQFASVLTKEAELPLCPTNILYFPQNLPMHCRMPTNADFPGIPAPPTVPQQNQNPSSDKRPALPVPIRIQPGIPGPIPIPGSIQMPGPMPIPLPGPMPMSGPMPFPGPMPMAGPMGMPGPIAIPGPMPLPSGPGHKLPVIVMPFYSPDPSFKKGERLRPRKWRIRRKLRRPHISFPTDTSSSTDKETSSESSSSSFEDRGWWKGRRNHRRLNGPIRMKSRKHHKKRQLLTPVLQYVTKDGYVIFEKKISKGEAKDWLNVKHNEKREGTPQEAVDMESKEYIENHTGEKETVTEKNVAVVTKRNGHKFSRLKELRNKAARKKN